MNKGSQDIAEFEFPIVTRKITCKELEIDEDEFLLVEARALNFFFAVKM